MFDDPRTGEDGPAPDRPPRHVEPPTDQQDDDPTLAPQAPVVGGPPGVADPSLTDEPADEPVTDEPVADEPVAGVRPDPAAPAPGRRRRGSGSGSFLRELPLLLLIAFVLAFLLRTFVLQVFYIPSSSMEPTLQIDDRMVVEKVTYRFREPIRGEVVVFEGDDVSLTTPDASVPNRVVRGVGQFLGVVPASARDFVKRVIGLPGDEILIEDGQVYVNGEPLDEPYVVYDDGSDYGPVTVPEDHLFFLGDNRPNSSDSRRSLGFVPRDHVVGRSAVIIWPFDHAGSLLDVEHEVPEADPAV
jgi:signal peptidase I